MISQSTVHKPSFCVVLAFLVAVLLRLPQLQSANLFLDGDESILGIMAYHLSTAREFPIFFYGQRYGFSIIETIAGAIGFATISPSALALKISMLFVWLASLLLLFLGMRKRYDDMTACISLVLLAVAPAWFLWSMKARGGYLTALFFSGLAFYLTSDSKKENLANRRLCIVLGSIFAAVAYSQLFFLPGLAVVSLSQLPLRKLVFVILSFATTVLLLFGLSNVYYGGYWSPSILGFGLVDGFYDAIPSRLSVSFSGSYYMTWPIDLGKYTQIAGVVWSCLLVLSLVASGLLITFGHLRRREFDLFVATVVCLLYPLAIKPEAYSHRYLLPLSIYFPLLLATLAARLAAQVRYGKAILSISMISLGILSAGVSREFADHVFLDPLKKGKFSAEQGIESFVEDLRLQGIRHTFSMDGLLNWNLMFYAQESIISRTIHPRERYPAYTVEINQRFLEGKPTALVAYENQCRDTLVPIMRQLQLPIEDIRFVASRYCYYLGPNQALLEKLLFSFEKSVQ